MRRDGIYDPQALSPKLAAMHVILIRYAMVVPWTSSWKNADLDAWRAGRRL